MAGVRKAGVVSEVPDQVVHPEAARWDGWSWREPHRGEHFRRCSYCGSIHPADLAAEPVWSANWADMKYGWPHKFYVDVPNREPARLYVMSASGHEIAGRLGWADLTDQQREVVERDGFARDRYFQFGTRAAHFAKFYSIHLRDTGIAPDVKADIEQRSGLTFEFADDRVTWRRTESHG